MEKDKWDGEIKGKLKIALSRVVSTLHIPVRNSLRPPKVDDQEIEYIFNEIIPLNRKRQREEMLNRLPSVEETLKILIKEYKKDINKKAFESISLFTEKYFLPDLSVAIHDLVEKKLRRKK